MVHRRKTLSVPKRYIPSFLTRKDKKKQRESLKDQEKLIKKGNIIQEKRLILSNQKKVHI